MKTGFTMKLKPVSMNRSRFKCTYFILLCYEAALCYIIPTTHHVLPLCVMMYRSFTDNVAAQLWYFTKCIYFVLSCYQIRSGYPTRIIGNVLTKNYNYFNLVLFKGSVVLSLSLLFIQPRWQPKTYF